MSAPTPTLYKPVRASRAGEYCARRATHRDLANRFGAATNGDPAGAHPLGEGAKTSGGKVGKGGNPHSLGNSGSFDDGATWRKPAETGGNPRQELCSSNCRQFCRLGQGVHSARD